jgi:hypothetical protein
MITDVVGLWRTSGKYQKVGSSNLFGRAQKYVVAAVLVPLSHVIATVQLRNWGTAGTIRRS